MDVVRIGPVTRTRRHGRLPTGTVTYMFTDVVGSTAAFDRSPVLMAGAMRRHDELIERFAVECDGHVVRPRGEGDSRFVVFTRAHDAVRCAVAVQMAFVRERWGLPEPLRLRIGIHSGDADQRDGDYYGGAVNRTARIRSIAAAGEILISDVTAQLACDHLPETIVLHPRGERRLKDLGRPEQLHQVRFSRPVAPIRLIDFTAGSGRSHPCEEAGSMRLQSRL